MDQCVTVERELEKVLHKFSGYGQLCERGLEELIDYTGGLKHEILQSHGRAARLDARGPGPPARAPQAGADRAAHPFTPTTPTLPVTGESGHASPTRPLGLCLLPAPHGSPQTCLVSV